RRDVAAGGVCQMRPSIATTEPAFASNARRRDDGSGPSSETRVTLWLPGMKSVAPFSNRTSVRHQMMLIDHGASHGSGTTKAWSECRFIEPEPGRAMLA